jgi:hypothetical protein
MFTFLFKHTGVMFRNFIWFLSVISKKLLCYEYKMLLFRLEERFKAPPAFSDASAELALGGTTMLSVGLFNY